MNPDYLSPVRVDTSHGTQTSSIYWTAISTYFWKMGIRMRKNMERDGTGISSQRMTIRYITGMEAILLPGRILGRKESNHCIMTKGEINISPFVV